MSGSFSGEPRLLDAAHAGMEGENRTRERLIRRCRRGGST
jgi:hypothetical protein